LVKINKASANATTQEKLVDEVNVTVENETQSVSLGNSTEIYNNSTSKMLRTSGGHKKPPVTKT